MALFRRRRQTPDEIDAYTASTARRMLAETGVEATIAAAGTPDATLIADGRSHPLYNLFGWVRQAPPDQREEVIARHLRVLLAADAQPDARELPAEELRTRIRTRLLAPGGIGGGPSPDYEREILPGLAVALCLDFPETVVTLDDGRVNDLALSLDELYALGARNVAMEPIDEHTEVSPGVWVVEGASLFIASKAADMASFVEAVTGPAPYGVVFGVPFRHVLLYTVLGQDRGLQAVQRVFELTVGFASGDLGPTPGGVVDDGLWFWRDGDYERVGGRDRSGEGYAIEVGGRFHRALEEIAAL